MIVYVPGRMPTHVGPYGAARYPGTLLGAIPGYYSPTQGYIASSESNHLTERNIFSGNLNLYQPPLDLPVWPRSMPTEDELGTSPTSRLTGLGTPPNGFASSGPPSPAHSDSDASNSSLELSSSDRGDNGPRQCRWLGCERWFSSIKQLAEHLEKVHAVARRDKLFYCGWEDCNRGHRGFNAKYKMLVHVRTHTKEKPHHCLECGKGFSRRENLKIHERSHTGERPYVCNIEGCGKRYSNSSDRFKHTRTHSVDKPYCCKQPGCSKRYTDPSSLRKHVKTYRHNVNNNDKAQEKSFDENNSSQEPKFDTSPEKRSSTDSDKKDSSLESTITTTSSSSLSPLTSHSFEEQRKFVEWNNMYNLQSRQEVEQITPPKNYDREVKHFPRIYDDSFRTPDRFNPIYPSHAIKERPVSHSPGHSSLQMSENLVRIGMQSTPIKREELECPPKATVDYRNIDSIVNSTPCKKENPIRHSVIKRADNVIKMDTSESPKINDDSKETCCCRHTCCIHNNNLSEKAKLLSDLLMKTQNPLFKQLLGSVDLRSELQNMWSSHVDRENVGQDLRIKSHESMTEMEQDLPLDLTSHK